MTSKVNELMCQFKEQFVSLFHVALLTVLAACGISSSTNSITVPAQDLTPPTVVLDLIYPQSQIFTVTSTGFNPTLPAELKGGEVITLIAKCTDKDGGCQNIQINVDGMATNSDGSVSAALTPLLAENPDPAAQPGGTALTERLTSGKLDIPQLRGSSAALRLHITALAINAHGATDTTRQLILFWSRQEILVVPPCPRFSPVGTDPPMVLDSRQLSLTFLNLMNTDPTRTSFSISMLPPLVPAGYSLIITVDEEAPPPDVPTRAAFHLQNSITGVLGAPTLQATTVDSRNCSTAGQIVTAAPSSTSPLVEIDITNTTTVVFSIVGDFLNPGEDIAVWNEIPFWQAFGGRTMTFEWIGPLP